MKKKLILLLALIFLLLIFLNKNIFQIILETKISEWTKYNSNLILSKLNFFSGEIEITNFELQNKKNFFYDNMFEANLIKIELDPKTYFNELVVIKSAIMEKPKFYFEIKNIKKGKNTEIKDNLNLIEKLSKKKEKEVFPKKNRDKNFIILNLKIKDAIAVIKYENRDENITVNLSDMSFIKVGNSGHSDIEFQHFKKIMRIILSDIFFKIPDQYLRAIIKEKYTVK